MRQNDEGKGENWYHLDKRGLSNLVVICIGVLLYMVLTNLAQVQAAVSAFMSILSPFIAGFVIAFLLNSPTNFFEERVYPDLRKAGLHSDSLPDRLCYLDGLTGTGFAPSGR